VGFTVTQMVLYQRRNASMGSYLITPSHINVLSHRVIDFTQAAGTLIMNVILNPTCKDENQSTACTVRLCCYF